MVRAQHTLVDAGAGDADGDAALYSYLLFKNYSQNS